MSEKLNFGELVRKVSQERQHLPQTIPGRMVYINFNASQLVQYNALLDEWRKHFKTVSEADAISVAFKWFLMSVAKEGKNEE